jgi:hypothetical protein
MTIPSRLPSLSGWVMIERRRCSVSRLLLIVVSLSLFVGCARSTLPSTPAEQPPGARVSAAYEIIGDRLRIEIDTDGRRLEEA